MSETILAEFNLVRSRTIEFMEGLSDETADRMPAGFRNNIRWHLAHIFTVHEQYIFANLKMETKLPENFTTWFGNGSSPDNWNGTPATLDEINNLLEEQKQRTLDALSQLDLYSPLNEPIQFGTRFQFNRVSELLSFMFFHEGNHLGFIKALRKVADNQ